MIPEALLRPGASDPGCEPPFPVEIRAHPRSRRMKLSYRLQRGFLLTHPPRLASTRIREFLRENQAWMRTTWERAQARCDASLTLRDYLEEEPRLTLGSERISVRFGACRGLLEERVHEVVIFDGVSETQLSRHLWEFGRRHLPGLLEEVSEGVGMRKRLGRIQVRDQRSRWGSCAASGNLSLNWRLLLLPPALQRHILLHELAHLVHLDHSAAFWSCLRRWDPDTHHHRKRLRSEGSLWMALGREG